MARAMNSNSALTFKPDALSLRIDACFPVNFTFWGSEWRLYWERPKGDMFAALDEFIDQGHPSHGDGDLEHRKTNLRLVLLGVAARNQALPHEAIRIVETKLKHVMPSANHKWRLLELFRAVARMCNVLGLELPECIRNPVQAWGSVMVWGLRPQSASYSKQELVKISRTECDSLKARVNPYSPSLEPELFYLLELAYGLTRWTPDIEAEESRLPNHLKKERGQLRRDVKNRLDEYRQSISTLATYWDRDSELVTVHPITKDSAQVTVARGRRIRARY
jgi:hypothetical protein